MSNSLEDGEEFRENVCLDCNMTFDSITEFGNHREKFCINSDYFDPVRLQKKVEQLSEDGNNNNNNNASVPTGAMTFKQVKHYLKTQDAAASALENNNSKTIGKITLAELRNQFQNNDAELESLRKKVTLERKAEKAEEIRALKIRQQKSKMQKKQEDEEIQALVKEVETRREHELRARIERESIKKEIRELDKQGLQFLEEERKRELAQLAKEKEALLAKEQEALKEIEMLEANVMEQEREFRENRRLMEESLNEKYGDAQVVDRKEFVRKRHMEMSKERGSNAAGLKLKREMLEEEKIKIQGQLASLSQTEDNTDSLDTMVNKINLEEHSAKLEKLKQDEEESRNLEEQYLKTVDSELDEAFKTTGGSDYSNAKEVNDLVTDWISTNEGTNTTEEEKRQSKAQDISSRQQKTNVALNELDRIHNFPTAADPPLENSAIEGDSLDAEINVQEELKSTPRSTTVPESPRVSHSPLMSDQQQQQHAPNKSNSGDRYQPNQFSNQYNGGGGGYDPRHNNNMHHQYAPSSQHQQYPSQPGQDPYGYHRYPPPHHQPPPPSNYGNYHDPYGPHNPHSHFGGFPSYGGGGHAPYGLHPPHSMYGGGAPAHPMMMPPYHGMHQMSHPMHTYYPMPATTTTHPPFHPAAPEPDPQQQMILMQHELENAKLQQELDDLLERKDTESMHVEKKKMDKLVNKLHSKLDSLENPEKQGRRSQQSSTNDEEEEKQESEEAQGAESTALSTAGLPKGFWSEHVHDLEFVKTLPSESELRTLQMQHLEEMAKMRFEMDRLEKEQKLETLKLGLERQKDEKQKQVEHEKWMADQKRQLMALRMRKVLAKELPSTNSGSTSSSNNNTASTMVNSQREYDPEAGFVIFWDYVLDIPSKVDTIQLTYAFYEGKIQRTRHKVIRHRECEPHGPTLKRCIFATKRTFEKIPPSLDMRLVLEISSVVQGRTGPGMRPKIVPIGWTLHDIFKLGPSGTIRLNTGLVKLTAKTTSMPDMSKQLVLAPSPSDGSVRAHIRVVHGADIEAGLSYAVDPDVTAGNYQFPTAATATTAAIPPGTQPPAAVEANKSMTPVNPMPTTSPWGVASALSNMSKRASSVKSNISGKSQKASKPFEIEIRSLQIQPDALFSHKVISIKIYILLPDVFNAQAACESTDNLLWQSSNIPSESFDITIKTFASAVNVPILEGASCHFLFVIFGSDQQVVFWGIVPANDENSTSADKGTEVPLYLPEAASDVRQRSSAISQGFLNVAVYSESASAAFTDSRNSRASSNFSSIGSALENTESEKKNGKQTAWLDVNNKSQQQHTLFNPGDGFDVYVDGGRFLPVNVSITKVTVVVMSSDMTVLDADNPSTSVAFAETGSSVQCPSYNLQIDYRQDKLNPTLTIVIRIDGVDTNTKNPVVVGYSVLSVFLDPKTLKQPTKTTVQDVFLNHGSFQLPIHTGLDIGQDDADFTAAACANHDKIPCATVLLRILPAKKSNDGLSTLRRADFSEREWVSKGLTVPAVKYSDGQYDSTACKPSRTESAIYTLKAAASSSSDVETVAESLTSLTGERLVGEDLDAFLEEKFATKPSDSLDLKTFATYQPDIGFQVSIDGLHNMPTKKSFFKAIYCLSPPSPFYQDPKLTEDVRFTTTTDWKSPVQSPVFKDDYFAFRKVEYEENLTLLIDIRAVSRDSKSKKFVSSQVGWAALPIFLNEQQCIASGSFMLPVIQGGITTSILEDESTIQKLIETETQVKKGKIKLLDGASVFVRIEDLQLPDRYPVPLKAPSLSLLPKKQLVKYKYDPKKIAMQATKAPISKLLPPKTTEKAIEKEINVAFSEEMDITHYSF